MLETYAYWISTALLSLLYLTSATMYIFRAPAVRVSIGELGYPGYLVQVLIVLKLLAVATLLSRFNVSLSDLAYAGMFFHLLLAITAHVGAKKVAEAAPGFIGLVLLIVSFLTQNAAREVASPALAALGL